MDATASKLAGCDTSIETALPDVERL